MCFPFPVNIAKFLRAASFFDRTPLVAASVSLLLVFSQINVKNKTVNKIYLIYLPISFRLLT